MRTRLIQSYSIRYLECLANCTARAGLANCTVRPYDVSPSQLPGRWLAPQVRSKQLDIRRDIRRATDFWPVEHHGDAAAATATATATATPIPSAALLDLVSRI